MAPLVSKKVRPKLLARLHTMFRNRIIFRQYKAQSKILQFDIELVYVFPIKKSETTKCGYNILRLHYYFHSIPTWIFYVHTWVRDHMGCTNHSFLNQRLDGENQ
jgi:hypothetical protein